MRMVLERAMGRASSTLSPGHRHFAAQTKELIAEIELLEEEVANREQQVLSLYRSVFEECISRPSSEQSSVMTSPAHNKAESRKHPSIISSAFCSSKKFPLRTFQALAAINDLGKRNLLQSKSTHASFYNSKANVHIQKSSSEHTKEQGQVTSMEKSPLARTLKDHLYQCPSKLSEEMVRCMAAIYCWLRITESTSTEQKRSPLSSRSSTNVIIPQHDIKEERDWFCKSTIEISWIATDKNNVSRASYAISNYRVLVEQLERVNLSQMETINKMAFWINLYNSLVMHVKMALTCIISPFRFVYYVPLHLFLLILSRHIWHMEYHRTLLEGWHCFTRLLTMLVARS
uniref:Electron transporter n=1 Tax=Solanum tuberosum TaxID=4113 RepID=M1A113_SOLTU